MTISAIGQDSHAFDFSQKEKKLTLGGVIFEDAPALAANSDGDVVFHAITNAISGVSGKNIIGSVSDKMCLEEGIVDSSHYLKKAMATLGRDRVVHLSISIEATVPNISPKINLMREAISKVVGISAKSVGITATTGEGLTEFGRGRGIQVFCIVTVETRRKDK